MDIIVDIFKDNRKHVLFKKKMRKITKIINYECSKGIHESIPGCP